MPDIQWHVGEDDERETIATPTSARRSRRSWIMIVIVVILGAGLGLAYRTIPEPAPRLTPTPPSTSQPTPPASAPQSIPAELYAAINGEAQALADGDAATYLAWQSPREEIANLEQQLQYFVGWGRPVDHPLFEIIDYDLLTPTRAWAEVRQYTNKGWFRETRFYRRKNDRWLRSEADPTFWSGETETLDTPHFHAIYAVEDRELVQPSVRALEDIYPQLCRDLGCADAAATLTFTLTLNGTSANELQIWSDARQLNFPSPRLTGVFEDSPLDNNLIWPITVAAVQRVYYAAASQWNGDADGHIMFNAIIDWALQRMPDGPRRMGVFTAVLKPPDLVPLSQLWGKAYVIDQNNQMKMRSDSNVVYAQSALVAAFIEEEYGASAMPKLLKALDTAHSFADMIENGLGISLATFDQKWHSWIRTNLAEP